MGDLRARIADQFSGRGTRADVWRAFDLFLETDAFLNLGYSPRFRPHVVGSSQRRLARVVGERLVDELAVAPRAEDSADVPRVLDVGCGRGGPAIEFAGRFRLRVLGVDLVPGNVVRARQNAMESRRVQRRGDGVMGPGSVAFLVGDATRLPIGTGAVTAATAVDALVYLPDREAVFTELARVLADGGVVVCSDLVAAPDLDPARRATVERFAAAWDMPPPGTARSYREGLSGAGFERVAIEDITAHSVGRFRKWTRLYRGVRSTPVGGLLDRWLEARGIDPDAVGTQIDRAHEALPALRHVLVVARRD